MKWAFSWGRSKKVSSINNGDIEALHNLVNGLTNKVNELSANLANYVTLTNANNLFVSKTQPIVLDASRDKPVKINGSTKNPVFIEFVRNNTNLGYVGLGSGNNNNINVGARSGDLCLEVSTGNNIVVNNAIIQGVANPVNNTDVANKQYVDNAISSIPQQPVRYWYRFVVRIDIAQTITATPTNPFYKTINLSDMKNNLMFVSYDKIKNMKFVSATPFGFIYGNNKNPMWGVSIPSTLYIQGSEVGGPPNTFSSLQIAINISNFSGNLGSYWLSLVGSSETQLTDTNLSPINSITNPSTINSIDNDIEIISIERV